jgi:nitrile hydratase accessory protein
VNVGVEPLPGQPQDGGAPVFAEPWQAKGFALVLALHERGLFTWTEWAQALAQQIAAAQAGGDADLGDTYYQHWVAALETLVTRKGASSAGELQRYQHAWDHAAERTPHGAPIELRDGDFEAEFDADAPR